MSYIANNEAWYLTFFFLSLSLSLKGTDCKGIKTTFPSAPDGMYEIQPNIGNSKFWAYCDMTSFGGGWTMCYSTDDLADPKTEMTYDENYPYGTDGYRTDCNEVQVIKRG